MKDMTGSSSMAPVREKTRFEERNAAREESKRLAREAAANRRARLGHLKTLVQRVDDARRKLDGLNVMNAITMIQSVSSADYDIYLIAETTGQARRGVLKAFGPPRNSVLAEYNREVGLATPAETSEE